MVQQFKNFNQKIFYALSLDEIESSKLFYPKKDNFNGKSVNLDLKGLKKFIYDNFKEDYYTFYYIEVPIKLFEIDNTIIKDKKYNMISVKTPFEINLTDYIKKPLFPLEFLKEVKYLYHLTNNDNVPSIMKSGLMLNKKSSNFGGTPELNAVYLYHGSNIDIQADYDKKFKTRKNAILKIDIEQLNFDKFVADEDYFKFKLKTKYPNNIDGYKLSFMNSLEKFGTCAYLGNIDKKYITIQKEWLQKY